jgi:dTDP-glucose 4,6-dehydratase
VGDVREEPPLPVEDISLVMRATESLWTELRGSHVLVTGGTGFFGRWMLESLLAANAHFNAGLRATVISRDPAAFLEKMPHLAAERALNWVQGSVATMRPEEFTQQYFDGVMHLATEADSAATVASPERAVNVITGGTQRALDVAIATGARRFLFASSGSVYGRQPADIALLPETFSGRPDLTQTSDAYAISGEAKRQAELLCEEYASAHGLQAVIARGFTFAGPGLPLDGKFAFGNFMRDALAGRPIVLTGDGTPVRSYLHAVDLTIWLWTMYAHGAAGRAYNLGSEQAVTLRELAEMIAGEFGLAEVNVLQTPQPGQLPHRYVPSTSRARVELGLSETINLRETIRRSVKGWNG